MILFGLQRGVIGSATHHKSNSQYYRELMLQYEQNIENSQVAHTYKTEIARAIKHTDTAKPEY